MVPLAKTGRVDLLKFGRGFTYCDIAAFLNRQNEVLDWLKQTSNINGGLSRLCGDVNRSGNQSQCIGCRNGCPSCTVYKNTLKYFQSYKLKYPD